MAKDTGGQAFPQEVVYLSANGQTVQRGPQGGMTLRDYFACQALTGSEIWDAVLNGKNAQLAGSGGISELARIAYLVADAMLAERNKE